MFIRQVKMVRSAGFIKKHCKEKTANLDNTEKKKIID